MQMLTSSNAISTALLSEVDSNNSVEITKHVVTYTKSYLNVVVR